MSALWSRANWQPQSRGSRALLGYWKHCSNTQQPPPPHCITISDNVVITFEILCGRYVRWPVIFRLFVTGTQQTRPHGWQRHKQIDSIRIRAPTIDPPITLETPVSSSIIYPIIPNTPSIIPMFSYPRTTRFVAMFAYIYDLYIRYLQRKHDVFRCNKW